MRWIRLLIVIGALGGGAVYFLYRVRDWPPLLTALQIHIGSFALIMGIQRSMPTSLPDSYYQLRELERGGTIYRYIGLLTFRRALLASIFAKSPLVQFAGTRGDVARFLQVSRNAEMGHLLLLIATAPAIAYAFGQGQPWTGVWLTAITIPWNVYPVLLQRYNRGRLERAGRRMLRKSS